MRMHGSKVVCQTTTRMIRKISMMTVIDTMDRGGQIVGRILGDPRTTDLSADTVMDLVDVVAVLVHTLITRDGALIRTIVGGRPWLMRFVGLGARLIILAGIVDGMLQHL